MSACRAVGDIILSERGGRNAVRVATAGLSCSWEVNRAGTLSCQVPVADLVAAGWAGSPLGGWVRFEHPTAGAWGGVVTAGNPGDGIWDIAAQSFHVLARKRLVKLSDAEEEPASGTPGGLLRQAFALASLGIEGFSDPIRLTLGTIWEGGPTIEVVYANEDLYERVLPSLADELGYEWGVTADRVLNFGQRLGTDKSATVKLVQGRHIAVDAQAVEDLWGVENVLMAQGVGRLTLGGLSALYRITALAINEASVDAFGAMMAVRDYGGPYDSENAIRKLAEAEVGVSGLPPVAVSLPVVDEEGVWADVREGDDVTVVLGLTGLRLKLRVMVRALDLASGVQTVSGIGRAV